MKMQYSIVKDGRRTNTAYECEEMAKEFCSKHPEYTYDLQKLIEAKKKRVVKPKDASNVMYPNAQEIEAYGLEMGFKVDGDLIVRTYAFGGGAWVDTNGKVVKNWKQKLHSVWFKPECKVNPQINTKQIPLFACLRSDSSRIFVFSENEIPDDVIQKSEVTAKGICQEYAKRGKSFSLTSDEYSKIMKL